MASLIPRAPIRNPLRQWENDLDAVFEGFFRPMRWIEEATGQDLTPPMDVRETDGEFVVHTELPGIKKEDIDITLENGVLTITAESKSEREEKQAGRVLRQERRYGRYVRSLRLGTQVDEKRVKANYKDGVLELILPKAEEVKPKKINVDIG